MCGKKGEPERPHNATALRKGRQLREGAELPTGCGREIQANLIWILSGRGSATDLGVMLDFIYL